jgi:hypothetical protein
MVENYILTHFIELSTNKYARFNFYGSNVVEKFIEICNLN